MEKTWNIKQLLKLKTEGWINIENSKGTNVYTEWYWIDLALLLKILECIKFYWMYWKRPFFECVSIIFDTIRYLSVPSRIFQLLLNFQYQFAPCVEPELEKLKGNKKWKEKAKKEKNEITMTMGHDSVKPVRQTATTTTTTTFKATSLRTTGRLSLHFDEARNKQFILYYTWG